MEIWKEIPGYEGVYEASDFGNIRSAERLIKHNYGGTARRRGVLLKHGMGYNGYYHVSLSHKNIKRTRLVHQLVAATFLQKVEGKNVINHIDGVRTNNRLTNLEWVTTSENVLHSYKIGGSGKGEKHPGAVRILDTNTNIIYGSVVDASRELSVGYAALYTGIQRGLKKYNHLQFLLK